MSKKLFTEEEQQLLRQNPYVYSVSKSSLSLTKEFKELFLEAYLKGQVARNILEDYGFDPDILGDRRIWGHFRLHTQGIPEIWRIHRGTQCP